MIPIFEPLFAGRELEYVSECIKTGWVSSEGPFVKRFEEQMATWFGVPHAIACSSGTSALEIALYALNLKPGAEVILPSFTIISCVIACVRLGLVPVLVDVHPQYLTLIPEQVKAKITGQTGAIMPVHVYGNAADMDAILAIGKEHGIAVIEDFAEAHGAVHVSQNDGRRALCGSMGDVAACSFYANKIIACGEGGMVFAKTDEQAARARNYRNLCFDADRKYVHDDIGYNFRMTNLQAAVGLAQLEQLEDSLARKRQIGKWYAEQLADMPNVTFHPVPAYTESVYWMFGIHLDPSRGHDAPQVQAKLKTLGVGTRCFFNGMHRQPATQVRGLFQGESYPNTDTATQYGVLLPSSVTLTQDQVTTICQAVRQAIR